MDREMREVAFMVVIALLAAVLLSLTGCGGSMEEETHPSCWGPPSPGFDIPAHCRV